MQEQDIVTLLSLLGDELEDMGLTRPVRLLLIGGAYMLTQIHNRDMTKDVDVIVQELDPLTSEEYRIFKQVVTFVAQDRKVNPAWLSDNIAQFLQSIGTVPKGSLWLSQGKLEVYIPDAGYILVTKLLSGRDRDVPDMKAILSALNIEHRQQVEQLLQTYLDESTRQHYNQDIQDALDIILSNDIPKS